jgi:hypothetical protein
MLDSEARRFPRPPRQGADWVDWASLASALLFFCSWWAVVALAGELGSFPASSADAVLARVDRMVGVIGVGWGGSSRAFGGAVWDLLNAAPVGVPILAISVLLSGLVAVQCIPLTLRQPPQEAMLVEAPGLKTYLPFQNAQTRLGLVELKCYMHACVHAAAADKDCGWKSHP